MFWVCCLNTNEWFLICTSILLSHVSKLIAVTYQILCHVIQHRSSSNVQHLQIYNVITINSLCECISMLALPPILKVWMFPIKYKTFEDKLKCSKMLRRLLSHWLHLDAALRSFMAPLFPT